MKLRVATRASAMATTQTGHFVTALQNKFPSDEITTSIISTIGDRKQGTPQASHSDKQDWIYDIQLAIVNNEAEIAIHSGKDVPAEIAPETILIPVLKRDDARDVFIGAVQKNGKRMAITDIPSNGKIGTASLRRKSHLLLMNKDFQVVEHRGNLPTRIDKLDKSTELSGIVVAASGLERLKLLAGEYECFEVDKMLPAVNQAILVAQVRKDRLDIIEKVQAVCDPDTVAAFTAERGCVERLNGDCKSAVSIYATVTKGEVTLTARVLMPDGSNYIESAQTGKIAEARKIGTAVANYLIEKGALDILEKSRGL